MEPTKPTKETTLVAPGGAPTWLQTYGGQMGKQTQPDPTPCGERVPSEKKGRICFEWRKGSLGQKNEIRENYVRYFYISHMVGLSRTKGH